MNTQKLALPGRVLRTALFLLLVSAFVIGQPGLIARADQPNPSSPEDGATVSGARTLPDMDAPPPADRAVVVDPRVSGWVTRYGTQAGLQSLPPRLPAFEAFPQGPGVPLGAWKTSNLGTSASVLAVQGAPDGRLFAAVQNNGLRLYAPTGDGSYAWSEIHAGGGLASDNVTCLAYFNGELWVGTFDAGVSVLTLSNNSWRTYNTGNSPLLSNTVYHVTPVPFYLPDVVLYISTLNGASRYHFDGFDTYWTPILSGTPVLDTAVQFAGSNELDWFATNTSVKYYDGVTWTDYSSGNTGPCTMWRALRIVVDHSGVVWFASDYFAPPLGGSEAPLAQNGVCTYANGVWTLYSSIVPGLPSNWVTDLAVDDAGRVWISMIGGAAAYDRGTWLMITQANGFPIYSDSVNAVGAVGEAVWFGHQGATAFSQYSPNWKYYTDGDMGGSGGLPHAVLIESAQTWIGLGHELSEYNGSAWNTSAIPGNTANVTALARGSDGLLYIGTAGNGLYTYDGVNFTHQTVDNGLAGNDIRALLTDHAGRLWAGTDGGLSLRGNGYWMSFTTANSPLTEDDVTALAADPTDFIWIGTGSQGINILDPNAQGVAAWSTQTTTDGLPSNTINALATDPTGKTWAATASGLADWDPQAGSWTAQIAEPALSVASDPQGRVWAGTTAALYLLEGSAWRPFHATSSLLGGDHVVALASDGDLLWALGNGLVAVRGVLTGPIGFYPPSVASFTPTQAAPGDAITISGDHFDERDPWYNDVLFGDYLNPYVRGYVLTASQTELTVQVPNLALTGPIYVRAHGLTGVSAGDFTVLPKITSISPGCLGLGSLLSVWGSGYTSQNTNIYIRIGSGPWRYADASDPKLIRQYIRPGDTSGTVQVRIGLNGPVVTSAQSIGISATEVVDVAIQQGIQGEQMIWGKRTLIALSLRATGGLCNAQVNGGYVEWLPKNGNPYKDSNVFLPSKSGLQVKLIASGTTLSETASFVLGVNGYSWLLPAFSNFNGVRLHLTNGPVELLTYDIPASAFNFINVGSRHHFLNIAVLPSWNYDDTKYKAFLANTQQGLENVARVYPQQDISALYGSDSWMTWGYMTLFLNWPFDLNKDDSIRGLVENYRDLINDNGSPFLDQAMAIVDDNLRIGDTIGIAQISCYDPFGDCSRYTSVSFSVKNMLAHTYLQESIHATGWVDGGSPNHAGPEINEQSNHSRYDEGGSNCLLRAFRQALVDETGSARPVVTLGNQARPYEFSLAGCGVDNQPRSAMAYVAGGRADNRTFLEPLDYRHTLNWLLIHDQSDIGPLASTAYTQTLRLNGEVSLSDVVTVTMSYLMGNGGMLTPPTTEGSFTLELRDAGGTLLSSQVFSIPIGHTHGDAADASGLFSLHVPFPAGAHVAEIRRDGSLIWSATVSANAPIVSFVTPNGGSYNAADSIQVSWSASDPDGDPLQFSLEYSSDNGTTWTPVAAALSGNSFDWMPGFIPAGAQARLRLRASDGFNTAEAVSSPFTLTARSPFAFILSPQSGAAFPEGAVVHLGGSSMTPDGVDMGDFTWTYDGDPVPIGSQKNITTTLNEVGVHTITLQVQSNSLSDTSSITVTVLPDYDRDGMPNDWELAYRLNPLDPVDAFTDADGDELSNLREYQLGTNPTVLDTDTDTAGDGAEVAAGTDPLRADQVPATTPVLSVGPDTLGWVYRQGDPLPDDWLFWITNGGAGSLSWTASDDAAWLSVTPAAGDAPTEIAVSVNPSGLGAGEYTAHITVTASGASGSPHTITVTLKVYASGTRLIYLPVISK